jgi:cysteinyl-tRNA synthetase
MLHIHNTLTRQKERFEPRVEGEVGLYVCGMTVYDYCHVGHARVLVVFDVLYRHLSALGYKVTYVRNITDVDDKIIARALEAGKTMPEITERFIEEMNTDAASLGVLKPTHEPRATQTIGPMVSMIETLITSGHAYAADNGDVYFSVAKHEGYGKLSGAKLEDLRAGERVAVDDFKQDPLDFVLWKAAKPDEPSWPSPWGDGRPGWHIECSAMSRELLGDEFDIHGGGRDLTFPHHENEIAQSEAATNKSFARYWMHNGFVRINDEKMSKSLGNFFTVRDVLKVYSGEEMRLFILGSHYRSPLNYATDQLDSARAALRRFYTALKTHADHNEAAQADEADSGSGSAPAAAPAAAPALIEDAAQSFDAAMNDDLNTAEAIAVLHDLANRLNKAKPATDKAANLAHTLKTLAERLGLLQGDPVTVLQQALGDDAMEAADIQALIDERIAARAAKDFARSDEIRDILDAAGIVVEDKDGKTTWRRG